jgi:hypothetical protein
MCKDKIRVNIVFKLQVYNLSATPYKNNDSFAKIKYNGS